MPKPNNISITDFIANHKEDFVAFETWLADDLTDFFIVKNDLNREYTAIIVDIDEDDPIGKAKDGELTVRLNGRFYMPKEDRNSKSLDMDINAWIKNAQEWFDKNEVEVHFDTEAKDLLKFTAFVDALDIPSDFGSSEESSDDSFSEPSEPSAPSEENKSEEESEESEESEPFGEPEPPSGPEEKPEEKEEKTEKPEEKEEKTEKPEESKTDLKDFEEALGL